MPPLRPVATVSAERRAELQKAFATFDKDGSGAISVDELAAILGMGKKISPEQARKDAEGVIAKYDMDGNNELDVRGRATIQRTQLQCNSLAPPIFTHGSIHTWWSLLRYCCCAHPSTCYSTHC